MSGAPRTVVELLAYQARVRGGERAFSFLPERGEAMSLSFAELDRRARALAGALLRRAAPGDRAVLLFQPGLDVVVALFGCLAAGIVAVPLMVPRRAGRDSSAAILEDCAPRLVLSGRDVAAARSELVERLGARFAWTEVDAAAEGPAPGPLPAPGPDDLVLLQYTSGSTSSPKGVMVGHGNMLANLDMIRAAMGTSARSTTVGWVPLYHDMGLVMQVMQPLFVGAHSVLLPPAGFMQRPLGWLRALSDFRAEVTCAPNFAFDLCVSRFQAERMEGIDLSSLRVALNGAEPVQAETVRRFAKVFGPYGFAAGAMYPGYGLAEATLLVSGGTAGRAPRVAGLSRAGLQAGKGVAAAAAEDTQLHMGCGRALPGERVAIVEPEGRRAVGAGAVGEIWVSGPHVAQGYWRQKGLSDERFRARIEGVEGDWLRTGDLGFLDEAGELHVTGRLKDLIIIRGVNHYPQDIERTVEAAHPALRAHGGAAFAEADEAGAERLVLVQEVERTQRRELDLEEILGRIRAAVAAEHELAVHDVALIRPATLPKTTSGKVQRTLARELWRSGGLERVG